MTHRAVHCLLTLLVLPIAACHTPQDQRGVSANPVDPSNEPSLLAEPALIRADIWTEWHYAGRLQDDRSADGALWQLELNDNESDMKGR